MLQWQGTHELVIITWSCYDRLMIICVFVSYTNQCLFIVVNKEADLAVFFNMDYEWNWMFFSCRGTYTSCSLMCKLYLK